MTAWELAYKEKTQQDFYQKQFHLLLASGTWETTTNLL